MSKKQIFRIQIMQAPKQHPEKSDVRPWYSQHINGVFQAVISDCDHFQIAEWDSPYNKNFVNRKDARIIPTDERKRVITMFAHGSKEDADHYNEKYELNLSGEALHNLSYALYELPLEVEVDLNTGDTKILKCDGKELKYENN